MLVVLLAGTAVHEENLEFITILLDKIWLDEQIVVVEVDLSECEQVRTRVLQGLARCG